MITYHCGSLFQAPADALLGHACNCAGDWGAGIAAEFRRLFPNEYEAARIQCQKYGWRLAGTSSIHGRVVCMYTSRGYGRRADPPNLILDHTERAVKDLEDAGINEVHLPLINSGLFKVRWELTEKILEKSKINFHVWRL